MNHTIDLFPEQDEKPRASKKRHSEDHQRTKAEQALVDASLDIQINDAYYSNNISYITKVLAMVNLPYKQHKSSQYQRINGNYVVTFTNTAGGDLPYGRYPRLIIIWLITTVMKKRSQVVDIGESLNDFMDVFGLPNDGRTMKRFKKAAMDLFDTNINIKQRISNENFEGYRKDDIKITHKSVMLWSKKNKNQFDLFHIKLKLTDEFYQDIIRTAFPIDTRAVKALKRNIALDLYLFLVGRVFRLNQSQSTRPAFIPINELHGHIGANYENSKRGLNNFQQDTSTALDQIKILWPQLNAKMLRGRLMVCQSYPHVVERKSLPTPENT